MIPLVTERLRLRAFRADDLDFVYEVHQNPDLQRFIPTAITPDLETAAERLKRFLELREHPVHGFSLVQLHSGEAVGLIMVKSIPPSGGGAAVETEIGWRQVARHCGQGYITEAASAVLYAVLASGLSHVVAVMHPENLASQAVAERIGMRRLGPTFDYYNTETICYRSDRLA